MTTSKDHLDITKHKGGDRTQKYISQNPIEKFLVTNFLSQVHKLVIKSAPNTIHEVGCGEGQIISKILNDKYSILGSDISEQCLALAEKELSSKINVSLINADIYKLNPINHSADLVICCEVLEHLSNPEEAMKILSSITKKYLILSVPREPIWRILNLMRFKYFNSLGNTPGHLQNWSKKKFIQFVSSYMNIDMIKSPLPWTILLCRPKI